MFGRFVAFGEVEANSDMLDPDRADPVFAVVEHAQHGWRHRIDAAWQAADSHDAALGLNRERSFVFGVAVIGVDAVGIGVGAHRIPGAGRAFGARTMPGVRQIEDQVQLIGGVDELLTGKRQAGVAPFTAAVGKEGSAGIRKPEVAHSHTVHGAQTVKFCIHHR